MPNELYPHLPSGARPEVEQRSMPNLANALYPGPKPPPNWRPDDIALIQRARGSDAEVGRRYGVSKQVVGQIRKLGRY